MSKKRGNADMSNYNHKHKMVTSLKTMIRNNQIRLKSIQQALHEARKEESRLRSRYEEETAA